MPKTAARFDTLAAAKGWVANGRPEAENPCKLLHTKPNLSRRVTTRAGRTAWSTMQP